VWCEVLLGLKCSRLVAGVAWAAAALSALCFLQPLGLPLNNVASALCIPVRSEPLVSIVDSREDAGYVVTLSESCPVLQSLTSRLSPHA